MLTVCVHAARLFWEPGLQYVSQLAEMDVNIEIEWAHSILLLLTLLHMDKYTELSSIDWWSCSLNAEKIIRRSVNSNGVANVSAEWQIARTFFFFSILSALSPFLTESSDNLLCVEISQMRPHIVNLWLCNENAICNSLKIHAYVSAHAQRLSIQGDWRMKSHISLLTEFLIRSCSLHVSFFSILIPIVVQSAQPFVIERISVTGI